MSERRRLTRYDFIGRGRAGRGARPARDVAAVPMDPEGPSSLPASLRPRLTRLDLRNAPSAMEEAAKSWAEKAK